MQIGKIKPSATIAVQFPAGVEVSAIQHEGTIYLPAIPLGDFASEEEAEAPSPKKRVEEKPAPKEKEEKPKSKSKILSEEEMMEMDAKELKKLLLAEYGVDSSKFPGKDTNKKLRELILKEQEGEEEEEEDEDVSKEKKVSKEDSVDKTAVTEILEDFDSGSLNKKKALAKIMLLAEEGASEEKINKLVDAFEDDAEADIDETAKAIAEALSGKEKKESKSKKASKKEVLVEADDLEVGNKVSVWWDDQEDWFNGEVKSIKKGRVLIAYDDDTEEYLDEENNTKIKLC